MGITTEAQEQQSEITTYSFPELLSGKYGTPAEHLQRELDFMLAAYDAASLPGEADPEMLDKLGLDHAETITSETIGEWVQEWGRVQVVLDLEVGTGVEDASGRVVITRPIDRMDPGEACLEIDVDGLEVDGNITLVHKEFGRRETATCWSPIVRDFMARFYGFPSS